MGSEDGMDEVKEMLQDQLKDAASAEKQAIQCMKKSLRKVSDTQLKQGIQAHIELSQEQQEQYDAYVNYTAGKYDGM